MKTQDNVTSGDKSLYVNFCRHSIKLLIQMQIVKVIDTQLNILL